MIKKECKGCGSILQTDYPGQEGFAKSSDMKNLNIVKDVLKLFIMENIVY